MRAPQEIGSERSYSALGPPVSGFGQIRSDEHPGSKISLLRFTDHASAHIVKGALSSFRSILNGKRCTPIA